MGSLKDAWNRPRSLKDAWATPPAETRTPTVRTESLNPATLISTGQKYGDAVFRTTWEDAGDRDAALAAEREAKRTTMVLGDRADDPDVRAALAAREGTDTLGKQATRVLGPNLRAEPIEEPDALDRDEERQIREGEFRRMGPLDALAKAWEGEEPAAPISAEEAREQGLDKPWMETFKEALSPTNVLANLATAGGASLLDTLAHFAGKDIEGVTSVQEVVGAHKGAAEDPDVQHFTMEPGNYGKAATGLLGLSGAGTIADKANTLFLDEGEKALFWDDANARPETDAALATFYTTGDRKEIEARPWRDLPARLKGERPDVDLFSRAALTDPELAPIKAALGKGDAYVAARIAELPLSTIARVQPGALPSDEEMRSAYVHREKAKEWGGGAEGEAVVKMLQAGLLTPTGDGEDLVFVPSKLQNLMRLLGVTWSMLNEIDVNPLAASALRPLTTDGWAKVGKAAAARLPTAAGRESMIESGEYDDWLSALGLEGSDHFASVDAPGSTWWSRVLTDGMFPEYQFRGFGDTYERAGGDPESGVSKGLHTADIGATFLVPADALVLAPVMTTARAGWRGAATARMAGEVGMKGAAARSLALKAAAPILTGGDGIAVVDRLLRQHAFDGIVDGTLNPSRLSPRTRAKLVELARDAEIVSPEATIDDLINTLRDRNARILDAEQSEGPAVEALRAHPVYARRKAELDAFVREKNITPQERDLELRMLEASAFAAHEQGVVTEPAEYLGRHRWAVGTDADLANPATGVLYSADGSPVAARPEVSPGTGQAFRQWFGASKVADDTGAPKTVYHGTARAGFDAFDADGSNHGLFGQGIYLTENPWVASSYTTKGEKSLAARDAAGLRQQQEQAFYDVVGAIRDESRGITRDEALTKARSLVDSDGYASSSVRTAVAKLRTLLHGEPPPRPGGGVYPLYASIKNPIDMDAPADIAKWQQAPLFGRYDVDVRGARTNEEVYRRIEQAIAYEEVPKYEAWQEIQDALRAQGYDGITHMGGGRVKTDGVRHRVWIAFDPGQIKSAVANRGTFDPKSPNILYNTDAGVIKGSIQTVPDRAANRAAWFGESAVKNADGTPANVYTGTASDFTTFDPSKIDPAAHYGPGFYFTDDPLIASEYAMGAGRGTAPNVMPVHLRIERPFDMDAPVAPDTLERVLAAIDRPEVREAVRAAAPETGEDLFLTIARHSDPVVGFAHQRVKGTYPPGRGMATTALKKAGFDGITHEGGKIVGNKAHRVWIAFDPDQVKSATGNVGTFDRANPSILHQRVDGAVRGSTEPAMGPRARSAYILKVFRSGDVETAFHESTHLLDLMLGPQFTEAAAKALGYTATQIADALAGRDAALMTAIRERIADAGTRLARGQLRPGSAAWNVGHDVTDAVGDLWKRIRGVPDVVTPEMRALWNATFRPNNRMQAIRISDARQPRLFHVPVHVPGDIPAALAKGMVRKVGTAREADRIRLTPAQVRHSLGLTRKAATGGEAATVDPVEFLANALALIGTEQLRRSWGFGKLEALTSRVAVPVERAARIRSEVKAHQIAALGGEPPAPTVIGGVETMTLTPAQQRGVARLVDEVLASPLGETLAATAPTLTDPAALADLSMLPVAEWDSLVAHLTEMRAGAGAFRERRAMKAAESGAQALFTAAVGAAESIGLDGAVNKLREAFVVSHAADEYVSPAIRDALTALERELGGVGTVLKQDVLKAAEELRAADTRPLLQRLLSPGYRAPDVLRKVSEGMAPEVVPVATLPLLESLEPLVGDATTVATVTDRTTDLHRLFTQSPLSGAADQMRNEVAALAILDDVGAGLRVTPDMQAALAASGHTLAQAEDAMAIVLEGVRRRTAAVQDLGADIFVTFAGSRDLAALEGFSDAARAEAMRAVYADWYGGAWDRIFLRTSAKGNIAAGPNFDQGSAALSVLLRLYARRVYGTFARRMAAEGVVADVAQIGNPGLAFERTYTIGSRPGGLQQHIDDVAHYIGAELGWATTPMVRDEVRNAAGVVVQTAERFPAPGLNTARGYPNPDAYGDALRILRQYGFKIGKGTKWTTLDMPGGSRMTIPEIFREPIQKVIDEAVPTGLVFELAGRKRIGDITAGASAANPLPIHVNAGRAIKDLVMGAGAYSFGMLKTGLTTGIGPLIRPAFFVGNFMGGAFQLYQGVGAIDAMRIVSRPFMPTGEGHLIRRVMWRMWKDGDVMAPAEGGFFGKSGIWHSDQSVASSATRAGLNSSLAKTELGATLIEDILRTEPTWKNRILAAPRWWQETLTEAATGLDNFYRVSTYVDALKRGVSEGEAAELARRVAFDYNHLTDFEKRIARRAVMFYAFQRNNQNLFWHTLLTNPDRVTGQLRLMRGLQQENLGSDSELFVPEWMDGRLIVGFREALEAGHMENAQRGAMTILPPMGVTDAIGLLGDMLGTFPGFETDSVLSLLSRLNPWFQMPLAVGFNMDIRMRKPIDGYNVVPNWLVQMDRQMFGGMLVDDVFRLQQRQAREETSESHPGAPVYTVGPEGAKAWWVFRNMLPTGMGTDIITTMQRADLGESIVGEHGFVQAGVDAIAPGGPEDTETARPGLTEGEELGGWLGVRTQPVSTRQKILSEAQRRREADLREKTIGQEKTGEHEYR